MWTKEHRQRQAAFERRRYRSDLTDAEWERIDPFLPKPARCGRKPKVDLREIVNGASGRVNPELKGTKVAAHYPLEFAAGEIMKVANKALGRKPFVAGRHFSTGVARIWVTAAVSDFISLLRYEKET